MPLRTPSAGDTAQLGVPGLRASAGGAVIIVSDLVYPSAWLSFAAASCTMDTSARGRGGRIRMVGALTKMTATT